MGGVLEFTFLQAFKCILVHQFENPWYEGNIRISGSSPKKLVLQWNLEICRHFGDMVDGTVDRFVNNLGVRCSRMCQHVPSKLLHSFFFYHKEGIASSVWPPWVLQSYSRAWNAALAPILSGTIGYLLTLNVVRVGRVFVAGSRSTGGGKRGVDFWQAPVEESQSRPWSSEEIPFYHWCKIIKSWKSSCGVLLAPGRDTVTDHGTPNDHTVGLSVYHELGRPSKSWGQAGLAMIYHTMKWVHTELNMSSTCGHKQVEWAGSPSRAQGIHSYCVVLMMTAMGCNRRKKNPCYFQACGEVAHCSGECVAEQSCSFYGCEVKKEGKGWDSIIPFKDMTPVIWRPPARSHLRTVPPWGTSL